MTRQHACAHTYHCRSEMLCPDDDSTTTRPGADLTSTGISSLVNLTQAHTELDHRTNTQDACRVRAASDAYRW
jgi:hypothetical protein